MNRDTPSPVLRRTVLFNFCSFLVALGLHCRARASHCMASAVAEHGSRHVGYGGSDAQAQLLCSMWDLPWTRDYPSRVPSVPWTGRQIPNHCTPGEVLTTVLYVLRRYEASFHSPRQEDTVGHEHYTK